MLTITSLNIDLKNIDTDSLKNISDSIQAELKRREYERRENIRRTCPHEKWIYEGTGRHGSDKGVDHYRCANPECSQTREE